MTSSPEINIFEMDKLLVAVFDGQVQGSAASYAAQQPTDAPHTKPEYITPQELRRTISVDPVGFEERLNANPEFRDEYRAAVANAAHLLHDYLAPGQDRSNAYGMARDLMELVPIDRLRCGSFRGERLYRAFEGHIGESLETFARGSGKFDTACLEFRMYARMAHQYAQGL